MLPNDKFNMDSTRLHVFYILLVPFSILNSTVHAQLSIRGN